MKRKGRGRSQENADYEVGYGRPPRHSQFKPGHSGNPRGRLRGQVNFKTALKEALGQKVTIHEGDRSRKISKLAAIIQVTFNKALKGDPRALVAFLQFVRAAGLIEEQTELPTSGTVRANDEALIEAFLKRQLESATRPIRSSGKTPRRKSLKKADKR